MISREQFLRWWIGVVVLVALAAAVGGVMLWQQNQPASDEQFGQDLDPAKRAQLLQWIGEAKELIKKEPTNPDHWFQLGVTQRELGNIQGAINSLEKSAQLNPRQYLPFEQVGLLYERIGNYEKAERAYLAAIQNDPEKSPLFRHILELYLNRLPEKKDKIPELINAGLASPQNSDNEGLLVLLTVYYEEVGDIPNALAAYERLLAKYPNNTAAKADYEELKKQDK